MYDLLHTIWPVLKLLQISDSDKPDTDHIYHLSYKAHCEIEKSKEFLDNVTLFVRSLINYNNYNDEVDDTYYNSESEYGNNDDIEEECDDDEENIFNDLDWDDNDSEQE